MLRFITNSEPSGFSADLTASATCCASLDALTRVVAASSRGTVASVSRTVSSAGARVGGVIASSLRTVSLPTLTCPALGPSPLSRSSPPPSCMARLRTDNCWPLHDSCGSGALLSNLAPPDPCAPTLPAIGSNLTSLGPSAETTMSPSAPALKGRAAELVPGRGCEPFASRASIGPGGGHVAMLGWAACHDWLAPVPQWCEACAPGHGHGPGPGAGPGDRAVVSPYQGAPTPIGRALGDATTGRSMGGRCGGGGSTTGASSALPPTPMRAGDACERRDVRER